MSRDASATIPPRAAGAGGTLAPEAVTEFLLKPFSEPVLSNLLSAYGKLPAEDRPRYPDVSSFLTCMASDKSSAMSTSTGNDLSYPMSSYFISSSHNTYLSGHQLYGEASVEAYTNVLKRGCRCLEIDVWDGDDSDTSSSDEDDEQVIGSSGRGIDRSNSKASRWNRVKARAARMRSRSRSGSLADASKVPAARDADAPSPQQVPAEKDTPSRQSEPLAQHKKYLSPQPSPALPPKVEPRVLHGYTLTQSVTFRSVCHAIKSFAFVSTDLPLIVSLEVHASLSQQEVMVEIMKEVWSGFLVDLTNVPQDLILPSPQALKKKILIKVKWTPNTETGESNNPLEQVNSPSTDGITEDGNFTSPEKNKKASKVLTALSELGVYTRAYTFKHFSQPEASIPTHVFSLSESKMHSMHADPVHGPALFDHNKNFLLRVFPKGTRINSSNVDPTFHWRQGAQMVALNWQKIDKGMMLNEGMFASTGGWVLKPEGYRCTESSKSSKSMVVPQKQRLNLEITFLAGQRIPVAPDKDAAHASKIKPYVKVQLHVESLGPPGQGKNSNAHPTSHAQTNTYGPEEIDQDMYKWTSSTYRTDSPDFGSERLTWQNVPDVVDELSFLRLKVKDDRSIGRDTLLAWACIRLDRLQSGYRFIHLLNSAGLPSAGALLVHVSKRLD
ncbi:hypothetical protein PV05_10118 [Exophiala xenobiotica]|uniref:Phosphoinositide phospholipase C n=1 Tax=Exophiala xenobiotica TaxID=348802 RepID=A0A0D2BGQ2_9EURO|nr:uncharacterized protein PV05_10118 [Exophiala xenobiotica]KIW51391.1 hypothetical protein PV05_10118 [Exophiala xenobiotica]